MSSVVRSQTPDAIRSRKLAEAGERVTGLRYCSQGSHFAPIVDGGRYKHTKAKGARWICIHCMRKTYGTQP